MTAERKRQPKRRFVPTHELTVTREHDRVVFKVMLVERGLAFERAAWEAGTGAGWILGRRGWRVARDGVSPPVTARRLGRGSDPKRGTPGRNRTIRVPDVIWALFQSAATADHVSVAEYLIRAGEKAVDKRNAGVFVAARKRQRR